jgi:hypothetical protein
LLILPYFKNEHYKHAFVTELAAKSRIHSKNADPSHDVVTGLYLSDEALASAWHHHILSGARSQTLYGHATHDHHLGEHHLDWESKTPVLAMIQGFSDIVAERMEKEN